MFGAMASDLGLASTDRGLTCASLALGPTVYAPPHAKDATSKTAQNSHIFNIFQIALYFFLCCLCIFEYLCAFMTILDHVMDVDSSNHTRT